MDLSRVATPIFFDRELDEPGDELKVDFQVVEQLLSPIPLKRKRSDAELFLKEFVEECLKDKKWKEIPLEEVPQAFEEEIKAFDSFYIQFSEE